MWGDGWYPRFNAIQPVPGERRTDDWFSISLHTNTTRNMDFPLGEETPVIANWSHVTGISITKYCGCFMELIYVLSSTFTEEFALAKIILQYLKTGFATNLLVIKYLFSAIHFIEKIAPFQ